MQEKIHQSAYYGLAMRGSRKFCQNGSNSDVFFVCFFSDEGTEDQNTTKSGPLSAGQQNAIKMAFLWRAMMAQH